LRDDDDRLLARPERMFASYNRYLLTLTRSRPIYESRSPTQGIGTVAWRILRSGGTLAGHQGHETGLLGMKRQCGAEADSCIA
jgi:hypothetical protein